MTFINNVARIVHTVADRWEGFYPMLPMGTGRCTHSQIDSEHTLRSTLNTSQLTTTHNNSQRTTFSSNHSTHNNRWEGQMNRNLGNAFIMVWMIGENDKLARLQHMDISALDSGGWEGVGEGSWGRAGGAAGEGSWGSKGGGFR